MHLRGDCVAFSDAYTEIINWVNGEEGYFASAKAEFAEVCDSWLCAYAMANNCILVTNENKQASRNKVPIPDICQRFGIEYINVFEVMRRIGVKLY